LQQVVAIACALRDAAGLRIWSIGEPADPEPELIRRFFDGIEKYSPQLVSWNGGGFDLPVLNHRALIHGVAAARYWDWGDDDREYRFNNYLARFHTRHIDVMDVVAQYQPRASAGLDAIAPGNVTTMAAVELCLAGLWHRTTNGYGGYVIADAELIDHMAQVPLLRGFKAVCRRVWRELTSERFIPL
jgi:predicted PolB exonuclease-like 3'-5' exonuclease